MRTSRPRFRLHGPCMESTSSGKHPSGPFLVSADGTESLSRMQARGASFRLTSRGVRLPADTLDSDRARWLAAQLPLPAESVLSHTTAARLQRLPLPRRLEAALPAHVTTPRHVARPRRRDITTHHALLPSHEVVLVDEFRVTHPARTYVDMASLLRLDELVALGDVVLRRFALDVADLDLITGARARYPGRRLALRALPLLDARAASPRESHLRVLLHEAGLPEPEVNGRICDEHGGFLAEGDLVFRAQRVIVEYDGQVHATMEQRAKDAARRALLREHGWIVVEIVGEDMHYPHRVIARIRAALLQAGWMAA